MATNNFYFENILVAIEQDEAEDFVNIFKSDMQAELKDNIKDGIIVNEYEKNGLRSYGGRVVFEVPVYYKDYQYKKVQVVVRSGYYAGLNIDYKIEYGYDEYKVEKVPKYIDKQIKVLCNKIAKIVKIYGITLKKVGQFSNGEAVYEKA